MTLQINWQAKTFKQLTTDELYEALKLRVDVFVVEQTCYYPELDNKDRDSATIHLLGFDQNTKQLAAYLRLLAPNISYPDCVSIGRVATAPEYRGKGIGHPLMLKALELCAQTWPNIDIKIGAQEHLEKYYNQHGFVRVSDMYLEDDIPHIDMLRSNEQ
ncbi:GNAT family N-acetyltransferase [Thalassomonas sp. M1454]|uniref:GNAT family N-acetyltransferase n=1 Tax=Thalassomonas sp. M1454 TaxID=2594477 RepID=UPI00117D9596|nr:GNAT family N-acetyltransferase [Thalassomonas sp. M1454]TRX57139.1 GNAT family N-acetyltransferase [Thalassomonas sp. M1454]